MRRWLVIIARERLDLWVTWGCFYGGAERIDILFDRRHGPPRSGTGDCPDRRARSPHDHNLRARGFLVSPQCEIIGPSG